MYFYDSLNKIKHFLAFNFQGFREKMKYKKIMFMLVLAVFLLSITCVSASEIDDTLASEDTNTIGLSVDNDIIEDNMQTSEENDELALTDNDETLSAKNDADVLSDNSGTYSGLSAEIGSGGNIELQHDYYTYDTGDTISISGADSVIDGKGAIINMTGSNIRAFTVSASGVTIKNLTIINANYDGFGGAIYFSGSATSGTVSNCNFINNTASQWGGAIRFSSTGAVTNCNFVDNKAAGDYSFGGAVHFSSIGNVSNCNFTNNTSSGEGGAINMGSGTVTNCNFTNNTANRDGGAIRLSSTGTVTNCNFTGNNATTGSAIYFYQAYYSSTLTVSDSTFLNNRANAGDLDVVKNDNNITITFTGQNNLLNAIYSNDAEVTFTNVTYWGANGIATVSATLSGSNKAAGQNITVKGVVNGKIIDKINVTDENGEIVLDDAGDYWIIVSHKGDLYYTEIAETLFTNMKLYANVTSLTTNNKTVNITAKSNIFSEVMPGKLLFILSDGTADGMVIEANYAGNGTWWAEHAFNEYSVYQVSAAYDGLDDVTVKEGTITIIKANSTLKVDDMAFDYDATGSTNVSFTNASGVNASVVGQPNAVVKVNGTNITVFGLNAGTYNLTVTTIVDDDHNPVTVNATITVNKLQTELSGNAITATYNVNSDLVVTLKDSNGNPVSGAKLIVDLNGAKTYTTDSNGQVKVSTKGLAPNVYTAKVTFDGNTNYGKSALDVKVTVKKATPKLTAKKKTFKTSVKTKKYTITLKDNTGKAIKKAKVTLKVKGKTYKATTNSKGKAVFKIKNLKKKGTFKATITYKGNKYYNKITKKANIKVIVTFKTVSKGSKDKSTVKEIQQALKDHGYYLSYKGHYLKVDGKFQNCTERSVKEFQHDKGLKVTGKVDEKTAKKLGLI